MQSIPDEHDRNTRLIEVKVNPFDDKPLPATKKTFEQLLQEELQKQGGVATNQPPVYVEEEQGNDFDSENGGAKPRREFLKRGQGKKLSTVNVPGRESNLGSKNRDARSPDDPISKHKLSMNQRPSTAALNSKPINRNSKSQAKIPPATKAKNNAPIRKKSEDYEDDFDIDAKKKNVQSLMNEINNMFQFGEADEEEPKPATKKQATKSFDSDSEDLGTKYDRYKPYKPSRKQENSSNDVKLENGDSLNEFYEIERDNKSGYNLEKYLKQEGQEAIGRDSRQEAIPKHDPAHVSMYKPATKNVDVNFASEQNMQSKNSNFDKMVLKMNDLIDEYNEDDGDDGFGMPAKPGNIRFNDNEKWHTNMRENDPDEEIHAENKKQQHQESKHADHQPQKQSKMMEKYFGDGSKPKESGPAKVPKDEIDRMKQEVERKMNEKIAELQNEINNYKIRNEKLKIEKFKVDEKQRQLDKQLENFEAQKQEELRQIEEFKEEEFKKIKRDRQIALRNAKAMENKPNRREREEIENLKEQLRKAEEEHLVKERKFKAQVERQKKKLDECAVEIDDLKSQIKIYESMRINENLKSKQTKDEMGTRNNPANGHLKYSDVNKSGFDSVQKTTGEYKDSKSGQENATKVNRGNSQIPGASSQNRIEKSPVRVANANTKNQKSIDLENVSYDEIMGNKKQKPTNGKTQESVQEAKSPLKPSLKNKVVKKPQKEEAILENLYNSFVNPLPLDKVHKFKYDIDNFSFDSNVYYKKFVEETSKPRKIVRNNVLADGKIQNIYDNNIQEVIFANGANRQTFPNGYSIVHFVNNDIKQNLPDGTFIYYYADHDITQFAVPDQDKDVR